MQVCVVILQAGAQPARCTTSQVCGTALRYYTVVLQAWPSRLLAAGFSFPRPVTVMVTPSVPLLEVRSRLGWSPNSRLCPVWSPVKQAQGPTPGS